MTIAASAEPSAVEPSAPTRSALFDPMAGKHPERQVFAAASRRRVFLFRTIEGLVTIALIGLVSLLIATSLGVGTPNGGLVFSSDRGDVSRTTGPAVDPTTDESIEAVEPGASTAVLPSDTGAAAPTADPSTEVPPDAASGTEPVATEPGGPVE